MEKAGICRECEAPVASGSKFCSECGCSGPASNRENERRQLTVFFCDMVGSTELSERLDPEDLGDLLNSYQRVCRDAIVRHGGHISQYLGDGVLAYFGYPIAHEDDAERAIRAALSVLGTVKLINQGIGKRLREEVHVRVGLHTGVVAIRGGPGGAYDRLAVGETVNLAARIQTVAPIDTVLVSTTTAQLARGHFEVEALSAQTLKGFSRPVELYRVVHPTGARTKFEAAARGRLTPHVGRGEELSRLAAAWAAVQEGGDRTVLFRGEAGIGKSRVLHQFRQSMLDEGVLVLECFCAPLLQATALAPVIEMLNARVVERVDGTATPGAKLEALRALVCEHSRFGPEALPLLAALLSIPGADEAPIRELSPARRRLRTLEQLREWLASSAERVPIALLFEDVQWADPSTLDLLDLLVRDNLRGRTLVCMTARPEFPNRWQAARVESIELRRLSTTEIDAMVMHVPGSHALPPLFARRIAERSEGVPLYVEELTKLVLDRLKSGGGPPAMTIGELLPSTVRGTLEARLEQVGDGRRTAQLGAVIGREFSYALIRAVAGDEEGALRAHLGLLSQSELAFVEGDPPNSVYTFKHALIQDAIYETIPKRERESFHERIFVVLETEFPELVESRPEMVAYHAEKANRRDAAIQLLRNAGARALQRTAIAEAVQHLRHGIELVDALEEPTRTNVELELQASIGPAYMATLGWAAPEVERSSERLLELATERGDQARIYLAMWGLWTVHFVRGELHAAKDVARKVYDVGNASGNAMLQIAGCHALGYTSYYRAELENARTIGNEAIAISTLEIETQIASMFQLSSGSIVHGFSVAAHWLLGELDQAAALTVKWHDLLTRLGHPPSTALSLGFEGYVLHMQHEPEKLGSLARKLRTIAEQEGYLLWISMSYVFEAWALAHDGHVAIAVEQMNRAILDWRATHSQLTMCDNTVMQVEVLLLAGRAPEALQAIALGKEICAKSGERTLEPELYRLEGEALEMLGLREAAITATLAAAARARELRALSLELRAAMQLETLSRSSASLERLRSVYQEFREGLDSPELLAVKAYLSPGGDAYVERASAK